MINPADQIMRDKAVNACSNLAQVMDTQGNDGWLFIQEEEESETQGWAIIAARSPKDLLSITLSLLAMEDDFQDEEWQIGEM